MGGDALYRKVPEVFHAATLTMAAIMALGVVQEAQATAPAHPAPRPPRGNRFPA